jgi:O-antigen/teichoic acid export membrane protein
MSLRQNFTYKAILTIINPLIGFLTFPYISRVLGVTNLGLVDFVDNTINYFLLFAMLGISNVGVRSIAAVSGSRAKLNVTFSNLLGVNLFFTILLLLVYLLSISIVSRFNQYSELFYIGTAKILFSTLLIEWFFTGIENFKYITIRTLLIKIIYVGCVFILIKEPSDYLLYFILTVSVIVVNAIVNILYSRNFVSIEFKELFNFKYMKENVKIGIYTIMTSMYLTFNVMYLGLMTNNTQVGFYTSAYRLYTLVLGIFTAFSSVMLPRMSNLLANGNNSEFNRYLIKSFEFVALFSVPMAVCSSILAPELIYLLCGQGYEGAILPMRIIMPALILVGIAQIIVIQVLLPMKKDNVLLVASIVGAVISIVVNILLVSKYGSVGSAIVMLSAEFVVTIIYLIYVLKYALVNFPWQYFIRAIVFTIPCVCICLLSKFLIPDLYIVLAVSILCSLILYFIENRKTIQPYLKFKEDKHTLNS